MTTSYYFTEIEQPEGWYNITVQQLRSKGAAGILKVYNESMLSMLQAVYPEHIWQDKLKRVQYRTWNTMAHQREFWDRLAVKLSILVTYGVHLT